MDDLFEGMCIEELCTAKILIFLKMQDVNIQETTREYLNSEYLRACKKIQELTSIKKT